MPRRSLRIRLKNWFDGDDRLEVRAQVQEEPAGPGKDDEIAEGGPAHEKDVVKVTKGKTYFFSFW